MGNKRIVINNGDGTVSIVIPIKPIEKVIKKLELKDGKYRIVDIDALPSDRLFRNAWTDDNQTDTVDVDITRAKEMTHCFRRDYRDKLMKPLDILATVPHKAVEAESKRQEIRDDNDQMQINIDSADNSDTLRAIIESFNGGSK
ncbi:hypothetical protein KAR91_14085 [Candidatus Pacearchaeota archaeon]|nr:hypothetical protein [Candidatus Pacearchaeota archaeon]